DGVAVGVARRDRVGPAEHRPVLRRPGAEAEHDDVAGDRTLVGAQPRHAAVGHVVALDLDPRENTHAVIAAFLREAGDRLAGAGIAADLLVQHDVDAVGLEIGPDVLEEVARLLAVEDLGGIADARLAPLQLVVIPAL